MSVNRVEKKKAEALHNRLKILLIETENVQVIEDGTAHEAKEIISQIGDLEHWVKTPDLVHDALVMRYRIDKKHTDTRIKVR